MSEYSKLYRDELRELNHPLNRLQLRFFIAGCIWMDRHPRLTDFVLFLLFFAFVLAVFFVAPID